MKRPLLLTPGDPTGIGPEVTAKALKKLSASVRRSIVLVGAVEPFLSLRPPLRLQVIPHEQGREFLATLPRPNRSPLKTYIISPPDALGERSRGGSPQRAGYQSGWSVEFAARAALDGLAQGLVTGPISKENLQAGGFKFQGHTDFLGHLCKVDHPTMMLANQDLKVTLVTVHTSLASVPKKTTHSRVSQTIDDTVSSLQRYWGIKNPKVAVAALNPHAGEAGLFGREEIEVIAPAIKAAQQRHKGAQIQGPYPADTLFAQNHLKKRTDRFDAVVCMYHDQGLIPVKLLDFPKTVNVSLGLPIIRTSVDHGTAFDIAGKNLADPSSMIEAIRLAQKMIRIQQKSA